MLPRARARVSYGITGDLVVNIAGRNYNYGPTYGLNTCAAHDTNSDPFCGATALAQSPSGSVPGWCTDAWCYVDPLQCSTGLPPTQSTYFPSLFYSYQTCGASNTFAEWFGSSGSTVHTLPELATVATSYVASIVAELEDNEIELRSVAATCSYDSTCASSSSPCCACTKNDAWGSAPPLTFQQTLSMPLGNGAIPGIDACLGEGVGSSFQRIASKEADASRIGYLYYGSALGTYMQWPGMADCGTTFDPRYRDWYAGAAAGPKDVLIVIDTSGSMTSSAGQGTRMELAIEAGKQVVGTLTGADYATVIAFSSTATPMTSSLLQATTANRQWMKDWIDGLRARGGTNFRGAMDEVFQVLQSSTTSSNCNRVVLFLSDGVPSAWDDADYATLQQTRLKALGDAHLLTYALGSGADTSILKRLACENEGIQYTVGDDDNLAHVMAEYYKLLSPMLEPCHSRWISYADVYTGTDLLGVCMPAYRRERQPSGGSYPSSCAGGTTSFGNGTVGDASYYLVPQLIGVACIHMSLIASSETLEAHPGWSAFAARVEQERTLCPRRTLSPGQLEALRATVGRNAVCGDPSAVPPSSPITYASSGTRRACSSGLTTGNRGGGSSGGGSGGVAGIAGVAGVAVLIAGLWAGKVRRARARAPNSSAGPTINQSTPSVVDSVPMGQPVVATPMMVHAPVVDAQPMTMPSLYPDPNLSKI